MILLQLHTFYYCLAFEFDIDFESPAIIIIIFLLSSLSFIANACLDLPVSLLAIATCFSNLSPRIRFLFLENANYTCPFRKTLRIVYSFSVSLLIFFSFVSEQ